MRQHGTLGLGVKTKLNSPCGCDVQDLYDLGPDSEHLFPWFKAVLGIKERLAILSGPQDMAAVFENSLYASTEDAATCCLSFSQLPQGLWASLDLRFWKSEGLPPGAITLTLPRPFWVWCLHL